MKKVLYLLGLSIISCMSLHAQEEIVYTRSFTEKLDQMGLTFSEPVEQWWHLLPVERDSFFRYDLALDAYERGFSLRYQFTRDRELHNLPLNAALYRASITAASNNADTYIRMKELSTFELNRYNADWGARVHFLPKASLTPYPKGKILALYREDRGLVLIMIFYETWNADTEKGFLSLRFDA